MARVFLIVSGTYGPGRGLYPCPSSGYHSRGGCADRILPRRKRQSDETVAAAGRPSADAPDGCGQQQVKPSTAQELARHSDLRLTMGVCTHIVFEDEALVIKALLAPPPLASMGPEPEGRGNGANGRSSGPPGENSG